MSSPARADPAIRVACVMMQRNEDRCLQPWLTYHGALFGHENLYVLDHGSDHPDVRKTLQTAETLGVHVMPLPPAADYRRKGDLITFAMAQIDALILHDFIFPLDCDEFLVLRDTANKYSCEPEKILFYLETLDAGSAPLLVKENLVNVLGHPTAFWAEPYQKVFFTGGNAGTVDHGSHECLSRHSPPTPTRIVYVHLHHKSYKDQIRMSRDKLRPFVDVDDRQALEAFRGTGWHLVPNLLKTEAEYLRIMTGGNVKFPDFAARLQTLGIDPAFCET